MKATQYHAKYFAHELTKRSPSSSLEKLSNSLANAQVDLNPHQIEAALFAFRSPLSKGAILADEVGLGKTIEAGLVLSQKWAERKRKILLIVPSSLRKQWNGELLEKFFLPSIILEKKSFDEEVKRGNLNPFNQENSIIICSYHFAKAKSSHIKQTAFDLIVVDEAHRLRNVYKSSNKIANEIKQAIAHAPKILLTATPLQNSLLELYGLVSIIDEHVFGDLKSFKDNYAKVSAAQDQNENELGLIEPRQEKFADLKERLKPVCIRTLRKQVLEYINYTDRIPITQDYFPSEDETRLYDLMTDYLQQPKLFALPNSQRQLITLILRKLLASSSFAIASTLDKLVYKLSLLIKEAENQSEILPNDELTDLLKDYETYSETSDEWVDDNEEGNSSDKKERQEFTKEDVDLMYEERSTLEKCRDLAKKIFVNSKGGALLTALELGFEKIIELGAQKKAIIFTESTITQNYIKKLLEEKGYQGKIVLFNGSNTDEESKITYTKWVEKYKDTDKVTGSKSADMRAALVDAFRNEAEIMIATEAAAEGVNLQFCSLLINYDLPWNPQRIEQRIGRCHRYGQKHDVVVINFINRKNAADERIYQLLDQKFNLFKGVFGASDEVLGSIESGVDFEKRIAMIYQKCRTNEEINLAFDELQTEMDVSIQENMTDTRQKLLENFDAEVHEKLRVNLAESKVYLDSYEKYLWEVTKFFLEENAEYEEGEYLFRLKKNPFTDQSIDEGPYKIGKNIDDSHIYRPGHPLAQRITQSIKEEALLAGTILFDYTSQSSIISPLKSLVGKSGVLKFSKLTVNSFEEEDHLLLSAHTEDGTLLDEDVIKKLFSLSGNVQEGSTPVSSLLNDIEGAKVEMVARSISERNSEFFDLEIDKLDKWSEDMKRSLEIELKKLEIDIKTFKTNAKKVLILEEKVKLQREIKELEKKRNEMRQKLFTSQDDIDRRKEDLISGVERKLDQKITLEEIFTVGFKVI